MIIDQTIKPCDALEVPVYFTRRTIHGIAADKQMFREHSIVILRYVEDDGKDRDILVLKPTEYHDGVNFWNTDEGKWIYG